jgi:hypothetical protein
VTSSRSSTSRRQTLSGRNTEASLLSFLTLGLEMSISSSMEDTYVFVVVLRCVSAQPGRTRRGWCSCSTSALSAIPLTTHRGGGHLAGVRCSVRCCTVPHPLDSQVALLWVSISFVSAITPVASMAGTHRCMSPLRSLMALIKTFPWLMSPPLPLSPFAPGGSPEMGLSPAGGAIGPPGLASPLPWAVDPALILLGHTPLTWRAFVQLPPSSLPAGTGLSTPPGVTSGGLFWLLEPMTWRLTDPLLCPPLIRCFQWCGHDCHSADCGAICLGGLPGVIGKGASPCLFDAAHPTTPGPLSMHSNISTPSTPVNLVVFLLFKFPESYILGSYGPFVRSPHWVLYFLGLRPILNTCDHVYVSCLVVRVFVGSSCHAAFSFPHPSLSAAG